MAYSCREVLIDSVGHEEPGVLRPSIAALGKTDLNSFHHAAISADRVDVVVEDLEIRPVVAGGQPLLGDRHADTCRDSLAERAGRCLDTGSSFKDLVTIRGASKQASLLDLPYSANGLGLCNARSNLADKRDANR